MLECRDLSKSYSSAQALKDVSFKLPSASFISLVGENGAGKSTFIKILSGIIPAGSYEGRVILDGNELEFHSPADSFNSGIAVIHQELALCPDLSVTENILLGDFASRAGLLDVNAMEIEARKALKFLDIEIDVSKPVKHFSMAMQQMFEIAKAVRRKFSLLILDEPTSSLTNKESTLLMAKLNFLKSRGKTILFVSHRMEEVFNYSDKVIVLRDGAVTDYIDKQDLDSSRVFSAMIGRPLTDVFPARSKKYFAVRDSLLVKSVESRTGYRKKVKQYNFRLRRSEIVGIAGLVGSGRSTLLRSLFGIQGDSTAFVQYNDSVVGIDNVSTAIDLGIAFVSESRKDSGLFQGQSIADNVSFCNLKKVCENGILHSAAKELMALDVVRKFSVKYNDLRDSVDSLSGGNQQKIVIGRWLAHRPSFWLLDEPTRGVDIGARAELYELFSRLSDEGAGILVVSSDLSELVGLCDKVLVMINGQIVTEVSRGELSEDVLVKAMFGNPNILKTDYSGNGSRAVA